MRKIWWLFLFVLAVLMWVPLAFWKPVPVQESAKPAKEEEAVKTLVKQKNGFLPQKLSVYDPATEQTVSIDTEEYIWGVVAAEMPASFHEEALKAQAVAARTYLAYRLQHTDNREAHRGADICTDSTHCQGWCSREDARLRWVEDASYYETKITNAIRETDGQLLLYDGQPAMTVYHALSAGRTNANEDVWEGEALPYLRPAEMEADRMREKYFFRITYSFQNLSDLFSQAGYALGSPDDIGVPVYNDSGYIKRIAIGDRVISGAEFRQILSLRSAAVTILTEDGQIVLETRGYGHGVGMSQYGADSLGTEGKTYEQILDWFYQGTQLSE